MFLILFQLIKLWRAFSTNLQLAGHNYSNSGFNYFKLVKNDSWYLKEKCSSAINLNRFRRLNHLVLCFNNILNYALLWTLHFKPLERSFQSNNVVHTCALIFDMKAIFVLIYWFINSCRFTNKLHTFKYFLYDE